MPEVLQGEEMNDKIRELLTDAKHFAYDARAWECVDNIKEALALLEKPVEPDVCEYSLDTENIAPWPRLNYRSICGFRLCEINGYKTDEFCNPSNEIKTLAGKCMKCGKPIKVVKHG